MRKRQEQEIHTERERETERQTDREGNNRRVQFSKEDPGSVLTLVLSMWRSVLIVSLPGQVNALVSCTCIFGDTLYSAPDLP